VELGENAASGAWDAMMGIGRNPDTAMKRQGALRTGSQPKRNIARCRQTLKSILTMRGITRW
jgi:phage-related minor tail protein